MQGESFGVTRNSAGSALWVAAGAGAFIAWHVSPRLTIPLRLEAVFPLTRSQFVLENVGEVFQTAPVSGRATLGGELHF